MPDFAVSAELEIRPNGVGTDAKVDFQVKLDGRTPLQISLYWADIPGLLDPLKSPRLRPELLGNLADTLARSKLASDTPLWLAFGSESGLLPGYDWESIFQPALKRPILRKSYLKAIPLPDVDTLRVVVCASAPVAKSSFEVVPEISQLILHIIRSSNHPIQIHIFPDFNIYNHLIQNFDQMARPDVVVYDPARQNFEAPEKLQRFGNDSKERNSWLRWINDCISPQESISVIHFVTDGYQSYDLGALALAERPDQNQDSSFARLLGAEQIAACATSLGAWAVCFASPTGNRSKFGLRLLADALARRMPGPQFVYDLANHQAAAEIYRFLSNSTRVPLAPLVAYLHAENLQQNSRGFSKGLEFARTTKQVPRWKAAASRYLEQQRAIPRELESDREKGKEVAFKFVEELLKQDQGDELSGARAAVLSFADALEAAVKKWEATLQVRPGVEAIDDLSKLSSAVSHFLSEVKNGERILSNWKQGPAENSSILSSLVSHHLHLNQSRELLGTVVRTSLRSRISDISSPSTQLEKREIPTGLRELDLKHAQSQLDANWKPSAEDALSSAWNGITKFINDAPNLTRQVRALAAQLPDEPVSQNALSILADLAPTTFETGR